MKHAMARNSDPITSHMAADEMDKSGARIVQAEIVLAALERHPGSTSRELALHCDLDRYSIARRLPELEEANMVRRGIIRKCNAGKRTATTWTAV